MLPLQSDYMTAKTIDIIQLYRMDWGRTDGLVMDGAAQPHYQLVYPHPNTLPCLYCSNYLPSGN